MAAPTGWIDDEVVAVGIEALEGPLEHEGAVKGGHDARWWIDEDHLLRRVLDVSGLVAHGPDPVGLADPRSEPADRAHELAAEGDVARPLEREESTPAPVGRTAVAAVEDNTAGGAIRRVAGDANPNRSPRWGRVRAIGCLRIPARPPRGWGPC